MAKMVSKQKLLLVKNQSVFNTPETSLGADDVVETVEQPEFSLNADVTEIDHVAGAFDQDVAIPGIISYDITAKVYMRTGGASQSYGQIDKLLLASGMTGSTSGAVKTYQFTSTQSAYTAATAWGYSGNKSTGGALLRKAGNIVWKPKWTIEAGKPVIMEISGTGTYGGAAASATQPSITKLRSNPPAFVAATTITINGDSDYKVLKAEIDAGQTTELTVDPAQTYGKGEATITDRKIKWSATVYQDLPSTVDPETALINKTEGGLVFVYGTAPNKITFSCGYSQITDIKEGDEGGVQVWNLSGQCNRNDFSIILDTTTT